MGKRVGDIEKFLPLQDHNENRRKENMERNWTRLYSPAMTAEINAESAGTIPELLNQAIARFPNQAALTCMGTNITFSELGRLIDQFASFLQSSCKVKPGDRVAIMLPNTIHFPIAFFAVQKIGGICVNTNPLYTPREMKHQFADSGAVTLIIMDLFMDKLAKIIDDCHIKQVISASITDFMPPIKGLLIRSVMKMKKLIPNVTIKQSVTIFNQAIMENTGKKPSPVSTSLDSISVLQYTGGTTGVSKGAMLSQRNLVANMLQIRNCATEILREGEEVALTALPLYHIFSLTVNLLVMLTMGSRLILLPKPVPIINTIKAFAKYPITIMSGVNTLYNALNSHPKFVRLAPKTIRVSIAGGTALQSAVAQKWQEITGCTVLEGFGLTEASPVTHFNLPHLGSVKGSVGVPVASTEANVVDESGQAVPQGQPGELIVKGPQVMLGYWNNEAESAKAIRDGWLWTGDIATCDEKGYFRIVDRRKDMILVSGFNVFPNEVEEVLASHSKVLEAAVIGVPDQKTGEAVHAFIVPRDPTLTAEEVLKHCEENLTGYKRPREIIFKTELPKTPVGKILRRELRSQPIA